ncbi:uncharacterized protein LOC143245573 [Tachypleus tridentatus]|uniref:uncharacterized protein LOC143245573 n=1 Tax=Tachypleus tridentatus TaxID=6853 RepID=UPI003FD5A1C0
MPFLLTFGKTIRVPGRTVPNFALFSESGGTSSSILEEKPLYIIQAAKNHIISKHEDLVSKHLGGECLKVVLTETINAEEVKLDILADIEVVEIMPIMTELVNKVQPRELSRVVVQPPDYKRFVCWPSSRNIAFQRVMEKSEEVPNCPLGVSKKITFAMKAVFIILLTISKLHALNGSLNNDFVWSGDHVVKKTQKMMTLRDLKIRSVSANRCPFSSLPSELFISSNCIEHPDIVCDVKCPEGGVLEGPEVIICLPSGRWSAIPTCDNVTNIHQTPRNYSCSLDSIPDYLHIQAICIKYHQHFCPVSCGDWEERNGPHVIKCLPTGEWSEFPTCVPKLEEQREVTTDTQTNCKEIQLPRSVRLNEDCGIETKQGVKCQIQCAKNLILQGNKEVTCLTKGIWSSKPYCVREIHTDPNKVLCTEEELPPEVDLEDTCTMAVNSECKVSCHESKFLVGPSSITCLPSGRWSATPYCEERCSGTAWYYKRKCYKLMWESLGMTAQWKCQVLDMEPLVIDDEDVYKFIVDRLTNIKEECLWTSLNDQQEELVWRDATGKIAKFVNWYPGEPDTGEFGYDRDCVLLPKWRNYQYSDYRCDDNWCKFMCQYNATNMS